MTAGTTTIPLQSMIRQVPGNIVSDMDGEKVMLNVEHGKYFNLGATGGRIWDLIGDETTLEALVGRLTEEYAIERSMCEEHVHAFLQQLLQQKLITVAAAGTPSERA
ncbi:lasso peptide biosynthesis PqqD family chaperone [Cohnella sp. JJ-181]|uniref:lasso peptide biosynthesis PqqD family chaperone n=1 Tax=Cohnella rhizoplanae TaxID=2974897 RepID=UPI0022FF4F68|nr:lasso peptide biosynthesis PqqD family chaperone [Cohnella sp. JJ-181]CAI6036503.1 hypothetical protein COHCIP112018_00913 [Cohnella sp. JJ-181]